MRLVRESPGGVRAGPEMARVVRKEETAQALNVLNTKLTSSFRETITPSRPSNNPVHNLDIKSDIMHWPRLVTS